MGDELKKLWCEACGQYDGAHLPGCQAPSRESLVPVCQASLPGIGGPLQCVLLEHGPALDHRVGDWKWSDALATKRKGRDG